jgi:hypothetical protein
VQRHSEVPPEIPLSRTQFSSPPAPSGLRRVAVVTARAVTWQEEIEMAKPKKLLPGIAQSAHIPRASDGSRSRDCRTDRAPSVPLVPRRWAVIGQTGYAWRRAARTLLRSATSHRAQEAARNVKRPVRHGFTCVSVGLAVTSAIAMTLRIDMRPSVFSPPPTRPLRATIDLNTGRGVTTSFSIFQLDQRFRTDRSLAFTEPWLAER